MELPPWLKIENLIGNLNLSGWFKGWFKRENKKQVRAGINIERVETLNIQINTTEDETVKIVGHDEIPFQEVKMREKDEIKLTSESYTLISKVNEVHKLNGSTYDFESSYKLASEHLKNKLSPDWPVTAATHMANAIQSGDVTLGVELFFNSFEEERDPEKIPKFNALKDKIKYCYERFQNLRHVDKSGDLVKHLVPEYKRILLDQDKVSDEDCEQIFTSFEALLQELFRDYKLKTSL